MPIANWWVDRFNNSVGSNLTYITNAYSHKPFLWLQFHRKKLNSDSENSESNKNESINNFSDVEKVILPFNDYHKKRRNTSSEYITIYSEDKEGIKTICKNYRISANRSFIVTDQGALRPSLYGGPIWEDEDGNYHKPGANNFNKFPIFSNISEELKQSIKTFHVFDDNKGFNVLFITSDETVYGFGSNYFGCCGLGHNTTVDSPQIIPELCNKKIKQFHNGFSFVLALNCDNRLFSWGQNSFGQLGIGRINKVNEYLKPNIIESFNSEDIDISCGLAHSLVLTSNGTVFGWGNNKYGQIGCGKQTSELISTPIQLKSLPKLKNKSIHCSYNRSFVLTNDGLVYNFGYNDWCSLGHELDLNQYIFEPKLIDISNIKSVCSSSRNTYLLDNEGSIYFCGEYKNKFRSNKFQKTPKLLKTKGEVKSLNSLPLYRKQTSIVTAVTQECVFSINYTKISKTNHKTVNDYYPDEHQLTPKTIFVVDDQFKSKNYIPSDPNSNSKLEQQDELGEGGFGSVVKVKDESDGKFYAIKKIHFKEIDETAKNRLFEEVRLLSQCNPEFVAQYYNSWFHKNCFYIQMELCYDSLKNILEQKSKCFDRRTSDAMNLIEFFISSQLNKEVLECVQYLHELEPKPIIHRDLKPDNILLLKISRNGRFIKLCDFGLAIDGSLNTRTHSAWKGTMNYMAPEVGQQIAGKSRYSTKADIFSLGKITSELFAFDINESGSTITRNEELVQKWNILKKLIFNMLSQMYSLRPTCSDILNEFNLWGIQEFTENQKKSENYLKSLTQLKKFSNNFFHNYFEEKIRNVGNLISI